jgi:hypothetical protein
MHTLEQLRSGALVGTRRLDLACGLAAGFASGLAAGMKSLFQNVSR